MYTSNGPGTRWTCAGRFARHAAYSEHLIHAPIPGKKTPSRLSRHIRRLRVFHGAPAAPPSRDPYHLLLLEQVAYLADDATRLSAFRLLTQRVGLDVDDILGAGTSTLRAVARHGGAIAVAARAERLRMIADRVDRVWKGDLRPVLKRPLAEARRELARYPSIGEAGAERILLLCGSHAVLGLDSNALRVLLRLGYGRDLARWDRTYREVQTAASAELPATIGARQRAFLLLRRHGQTLCRRSAPRCVACPLVVDCPTGRDRTS